jgi:hypothetical protein
MTLKPQNSAYYTSFCFFCKLLNENQCQYKDASRVVSMSFLFSLGFASIFRFQACTSFNLHTILMHFTDQTLLQALKYRFFEPLCGHIYRSFFLLIQRATALIHSHLFTSIAMALTTLQYIQPAAQKVHSHFTREES